MNVCLYVCMYVRTYIIHQSYYVTSELYADLESTSFPFVKPDVLDVSKYKPLFFLLFICIYTMRCDARINETGIVAI